MYSGLSGERGKSIGEHWVALAADSVQRASVWYHGTLDGFAKLLAPLLTLLTGCYAIYKWHAFSERKLQYRLNDFLKREDERLTSARPQLRKIVERPGYASPFKCPVFLSVPLERAVRELGWGSYFMSPQLGFAEAQLDASIVQLEKQLELWKKRQQYFKDQLSSAHLLKGAMLAAQAAKAEQSGKNDRAQINEALRHFDAVLGLNEKDIDALEYASHMRLKLGQYPEAMRELDSLIEATANQEKSLSRARALRYQSNILTIGAQPQRRRARRLLKSALKVLPNLHGDEWIEEAELHECLGKVQMDLRAHRKARAELEIAKAIFELIQNAEGERGAKRVQDLMDQLVVPTDQVGPVDQDDDDDEESPTTSAVSLH